MRLVCALLATALLAGCGGRPPRAEDFVKHANVICADMKRNLTAAASSDDFAELTLVIVERGTRAMRALPVPEDLRARVLQMLAHIDASTRATRAALDAATRGDAARAERAQEGLRRSRNAYVAIARELGLKECVSQASPSPSPTR